MLKRFAPLVPIALSVLLAACANQQPTSQYQMDLAQQQPQQPVEKMTDEQMAAVTNYVITHFGNKSSKQITPDEIKAMRPEPQTGEE